MSKIIPLTRGKSTIVDDIDYDWVMQWKWHACLDSRPNGPELWYAKRTRYENGTKFTLCLHREIATRAGLPESRYYDHRDSDGLNNQRSNIRPCTQSQNVAHARKPSGKSSKFVGVDYQKSEGRWRVRIGVQRKSFFVGLFDTEESALAAYREAAKKHFGEFARP